MTISEIPKYMAICLIITIVIETAVAIIIGIKDKKDIANVLLVNLVTNPLVFALPIYFQYKFGYQIGRYLFYVLEVITLFVEFLIYKFNLKYKTLHPLIVSFILNASSFFVGVLMNYY